MDENDNEPEPETTALMQACQNGDDEQVKKLLEQGENVLEVNSVNRTALHYCAENLNLNCAELLLNADSALINMKDSEGYTTMHMAIMSGNKPMLEFLIKKDGDVNSEDLEKHSLIHWATVCAQLDCLELLIAADADPSTPDSHGAHPIHYAAQMCGVNTELNNDAEMGMKALQMLLDQNVSVTCTDQDNRQPLLWAASAGSAEACMKLIEAGATVSAADRDGLSALHCAASRDHRECVERILSESGAEVDIKDKNGCAPLFYAVTLGHPECTKLLLDKGALPDLQDKKGRSPAHCGAAKGQLETLKILEQHEGNLWLRNIRGDSPIHEAVQSGEKTLVQYLLDQKPSAVNIANSDGRTPIHIATVTNNIEMCKLLVQNKADVNSVMKNNKRQYLTSLDIAMQKEYTDITDYLKSLNAKEANEIIDKSEFVLKEEKKKAERQLQRQKSLRKIQDTPEMKPKKEIIKESVIKEEDESKENSVDIALSESEAGERNTEVSPENDESMTDNNETTIDNSTIGNETTIDIDTIENETNDADLNEDEEHNDAEQNENGENENKENEIKEEKTEPENVKETNEEKLEDLTNVNKIENNVKSNNKPKKRETIKQTKNIANSKAQTSINKNIKSDEANPLKKEHPEPMRSKTSTSALTRPKTKANILENGKSPNQDRRPNTTTNSNLKPRPIRPKRIRGANANHLSTLRYEQERRIFQELLEVKRVQILYSRANEEAMVRRLINNYMRRTHYETKEPNVKTLAAWEKWLHDQLRQITMENDSLSVSKIKEDNGKQINRKRKQGLGLQDLSSSAPARTTDPQSPGFSEKSSERLPNINSMKRNETSSDLLKDSSSDDGDFVQGLSISLSSSQSSDDFAPNQVIKRSSKKTPPNKSK